MSEAIQTRSEPPGAPIEVLGWARSAAFRGEVERQSGAAWLASRVAAAAEQRGGVSRPARVVLPSQRLSPVQLSVWYRAAVETALATRLHCQAAPSPLERRVG